MSLNQHGWYTPEERIQHVERFLTSNLSLTKYSENNNLKRSTLATWVRHYNSANLIANNTFQNVTTIIKNDSLALPNGNIKLNVPSGISLEFDISLLHQVLEELK